MKRLVALACAVLIAAPGVTQTPSAPPAAYGPPIGISEALKLIDRGMKQGAAKGLKLSFAVVEPSGELVAFARMDDVPYATIRVAQQKARTSARFRLTTAEFEDRVTRGRTVLLSSDEIIAVGGGVPIVANGKVIGALGVSGASAAEDAALAQAIVDGR